MKKLVLILMSSFFFNCSSDDNKIENENLLGKWKLIEQYSDPGDGSGSFNSIESDREIEFFSNGTVTINGILCYMSLEVDNQSYGTFNETVSEDFDGEILPEGCDNEGRKIYYQLDDSNLILWYLCIEGCGQKFVKVE